MQEPNGDAGNNCAQHVCRRCKLRKRKCDKALPECSSCVKRNVSCEYHGAETDVWSEAAPSSELHWFMSSFHGEARYAQTIDYATMLFLDPGLVRSGQVELPPPMFPIPDAILQLLGDMRQIRRTAARFFAHMHRWLPFISKTRLHELHLRPGFHVQPDVVLLLLSLELITTKPSDHPRNPRTSLYHTVKHLHLDIECSGVFSILVLQAGVLLALYEIVHAIYPAAFLSVGACARYAHALGINVSRHARARKVLSLVEAEERRRVWWAIVILDRFVSIGSVGRPFATKSPQMDDLLPTNDAAWDQGIVRPEEFFTISQPLTTHMTKFALLCQAATLLGQVLQYIADDSLNSDDDMWRQLNRTLQSMLAAAQEVEVPDEDQVSLIYSALVALYTPWASTDPAFPASFERHRDAKLGLESLINLICERIEVRECFVGRDPEDVPPWGHYFAYQIVRMLRQTSPRSTDTQRLLTHLRHVFELLDSRWSVAGVYLRCLEAQEVEDHL